MVEGAQAKVKLIVKVDVHAPIFYFPKNIRQSGGMMFDQPRTAITLDASHSRRRCIRNGHREGLSPSSGTLLKAE